MDNTLSLLTALFRIKHILDKKKDMSDDIISCKSFILQVAYLKNKRNMLLKMKKNNTSYHFIR